MHLGPFSFYYVYQCLGVLLWSTEVLTQGLLLLFGVLFSIVDCVVIKPQLATARLRLHASMMSICLSVCLSVCLFVCLSPKCKKRDFLKN